MNSIPTYEPEHPLGENSIAVKLSETSPELIYDFFQSRAAGLQNFTIIGDEYLEFVPIPEAPNFFVRSFRQLSFLFWQTFRAEGFVEAGQVAVAEKAPENPTGESFDFFCQERVKNQVIFEGKEIQVLYPDNPITPHHFLFATKEHRKDFKETTKEEFVELMELVKKVSSRFEGERIILCKAGIDAGQTVPHFHLHFIVSQDPYWPRLRVFCNILFGFLTPRLRGAPLDNRVEHYRAELKKDE